MPTQLQFLFDDLAHQGFSCEMVDVEFQTFLLNELFPDEKAGFKARVIGYIRKYMSILPTQTFKSESRSTEQPTPVVQMPVVQKPPTHEITSIDTESLVFDMPAESEEVRDWAYIS